MSFILRWNLSSLISLLGFIDLSVYLLSDYCRHFFFSSQIYDDEVIKNKSARYHRMTLEKLDLFHSMEIC